MKNKPVSETVLPWLRANLGKHCLGALTGSDLKALRAAVHIIELYAYDEHPSLLVAFAHVVRRMQPSTRSLAYHAIAHVLDWGDRSRIWVAADLPEFAPERCAFE